MLHFILGAAGTGKTTWIYRKLSEDAVRYPNRKLFLFVPEQQALKAEQELVRYSSVHGLLNTEVLSFRLLSYRVMEELGVPAPALLDEVMKSMLLRRAASKVRKELRVYGKKLDKRGFIDQLKMLCSELSQYDVTVEMLKKAEAGVHSPLLREKLHDLILILDRFYEEIADVGSLPEGIPSLLIRTLPLSHFLDGAELYFDGFTGFTPQQMHILEHILPACAECTVSLTIPEEAHPFRLEDTLRDRTDLFRLSRETIHKLCVTAEKNGIRRGETLYMEAHANAPKLSLMEAATPSEEVRAVASMIRKLTVTGEDALLRYRRVAVAMTDPASYRELIKREFTRQQIPFFIDDTSDGAGSAAAELLRSALFMITGGYRFEDVIGYFRNPLFTVREGGRELTDELENHLRKRGLRGRKAMEGIWFEIPEGEEMDPRDEKRLARLEPVFRLHDRLVRERKDGERARALTAFILELGAEEGIEQYAGALEELGLPLKAGNERSFFRLVLDYLKRLSDADPGDELPLPEYARITLSGLCDLRTGTLPETMDCVLVGDLRRSRFEEIDLLFLMGANDGLLPQTVSGGGIFTDTERREISGLSIELAPDDRADSMIQSFYLYLMLHKPKNGVILSYARTSAQGKTLRPSPVVLELRGAGEAARALGAEDCIEIGSFADAEEILAEGFGKGRTDDRFRELIAAVVRAGDREEALRLAEAADLCYCGTSISGECAGKLYGDSIRGSVSRVERYEACPYQHFLCYGLGLKERERFSVERFDIGTIYHKIISDVFASLRKQGKTITGIGEPELDRVCRDCIEQVREEFGNGILRTRPAHQFLGEQIEKVSIRTLRTIRKHYLSGRFEPVAEELAFHLREDGFELSGRIDRVDTWRAGSRVYVRVVDYKSGNKVFSPKEVAEGRQLQLCIYMAEALKDPRIVEKDCEGVPAGMFYYSIKNPVAAYHETEDPENVIARELVMDGVVNSAPEVLTAMDEKLGGTGSGESDVIGQSVRKGAVSKQKEKAKTVSEIGELVDTALSVVRRDMSEIREGNAEKHPYRSGTMTACGMCPYHAVCRFDRSISGYTYRNPDGTADREQE